MANLRYASSVLKLLKSAIAGLRFEISNLKFLWWWLRQMSGDAAYERYLESNVRFSKGECCACEATRILTRQEFYLDALERRYSGVSRCC